MKKHIKKSLSILLVLVMTLTAAAVPIYAQDKSEKEKLQQSAEIKSKDEVVYATLDFSGKPVEAYVVNILEIAREGAFKDYGTYSSIENLTDTTELKQGSNAVTGYASEGKFYYQGNISYAKLPWNVDIIYTLDGEEISPDNIGGKSGKVGITIKTSQRENVNPAFYENYLLQISVTLSADKCSNIYAKGATVANAGSNKLVTITVMPGKDSENTVEADAVNFSMPGIGINAVPYNMDVEMPDTSTMTDGFVTLSDGVAQLDDGVAKLKDGAKMLADGQEMITAGSTEIMNGLEQLNEASDALVEGSREIKEALKFISDTISSTLTDENINQIEDLYEELETVTKILKEVPEILDGMNKTSQALYKALKIAVDAIPDEEVTPEQIRDLYDKNPDNEALVTLVQSYYAARTVKTTFKALGPALEASNQSMSSTMKLLSSEIDKLSEKTEALLGNEDMIANLKQLRSGMKLLSDSYNEFDSGLKQFTNGVSMLADNYTEFDAGLSEAADGTSQLKDGVDALKDGTAQLYNGTKDLPDIVENAINSMTAEYDHSDFKPVSYTSDKNANIGAVQFVFSTAPIEAPIPEKEEEKSTEDDNFIDRIVNLFKMIFGKEDEE